MFAMKIVSVDVMQVPSGNAVSSRGDWCPVIVRINTDEGISGLVKWALLILTIKGR